MAKKIVIIAGIIAALLVLAYVGVSIFIANKFTTPHHNPLTVGKDAVSANSKDVEFTTADNVLLKAWSFPVEAAKCAVIFIPGVDQNRINPDYNGVQLTKDTLAEGYSVLLYDPRGSGTSGGDRIGYGSLEGQDIRAAIKYMNTQGFPSENIGLIGSSLGAITTLQNIELLDDVGAVVVDSPGTEMTPLIENGLKTEHVPTFLAPGIFTAAKYLFGVDIMSVRPIDHVGKTPDRAILYLHGVADSLIPVENSRTLVKASSSKSKLVEFAGAEHVKTYSTNPELYRTEVFSFLKDQMPQCK